MANYWYPQFGGGGGGVAAVTATLPIKSSGGANPDISTSNAFYDVGNVADWPYTTIAAAIAAAVADGATKAFIRLHVSIVEDVVLPRGMTLTSSSPTSQPNLSITGNITNSIGDGTIGTVQGFLLLRAGVGEIITANAGTNLVIKNCVLGQFADFPILVSTAGANVNFYDSVFIGGGIATAPGLDINEGNINLDHCSTLTIGSGIFADVTGGGLGAQNNTIIVGSCLCSVTGSLDFRDTLVSVTSGPCASLGAGTRSDFTDVQLASTDLGTNCLVGTGTLHYAAVTMIGTQTAYDATITFNPFVEIFEEQDITNVENIIVEGGIDNNGYEKWKRTTTAIDYTALVSDCIIGVTNTAIPRTITLPAAATCGEGFIYHIKDESGGAGANNITIDADGAETIDGALTVLINTNYGSKSLYCTGAAWFVF